MVQVTKAKNKAAAKAVVVQPAKTTLAEVTLNANISTNDIIDAFVTDFETNRDNDRKGLLKDIERIETDIKKSAEHITTLMKKEVPKYEGKGAVSGVKITLNAQVHNIDFDKNEINIIRSMSTKSSKDHVISKDFDSIYVPFPTAIAKEHGKLLKTRDDLKADLSAVAHDLANLPKKTRQIRGVIAKRKLSDAGMDTLVNDKELQKIIA